MNRLKTQEIILAIIGTLSLIYVVYRIFRNTKNHDCDKCNH
ncbi:MAG: FeoB-associated Cys-rich membrane protein [Bacteroidetes bacterium]|nr:FeoB-associated Cys-rich membrane protein [Bacteroidota bacterium]